MIEMRRTIGLVALGTLGALIVTSDPTGPSGTQDRFVLAMWLLLTPLVVTIGGLVRGAYWSRWMALAAGIAVLPWASVLASSPSYGMPVIRPTVALGASLVLLLSLSGRAMFERYEGGSTSVDWSGPRMTLVRWTIICNMASVLAFYLFVVAYDYRIEWHILIPGSLLLGLILGVLLLARQKTVGLLLIAICCVCFVPAGGYFVWTEASHVGEAILFGAIFFPGVLTGWASLFAFGKPMWRYLLVGVRP